MLCKAGWPRCKSAQLGTWLWQHGVHLERPRCNSAQLGTVAKAMYLTALTYISAFPVPCRSRCKSAQIGTWLWQHGVHLERPGCKSAQIGTWLWQHGVQGSCR